MSLLGKSVMNTKLHIPCIAYFICDSDLVFIACCAFIQLKIFSDIFSYFYVFYNHKVLTFLSLLTVLLAIFNNTPYNTYANNFCIFSFDLVRPFWGLCDKLDSTKVLKI